MNINKGARGHPLAARCGRDTTKIPRRPLPGRFFNAGAGGIAARGYLFIAFLVDCQIVENQREMKISFSLPLSPAWDISVD